MVAGMERATTKSLDVSVMRISERIDQPEFTQLDLEISFADQTDVLKIAEKVLAEVFEKVVGNLSDSNADSAYDIFADTQCINMDQDQPDLRFENKLVDVTRFSF
jgi:aspartyl-tRNA synthetase